MITYRLNQLSKNYKINKTLSICLLLSLFISVSLLRLDPDFGWHLQAGNYFRNNGIPVTDIFTYTAADFPWVNHEWLNDVILSFLYQYGGYTLIAIFFGILWTTAVFLASKQKQPLALILGSLALVPYSGIRPIVWSLVFFVILLRIIYELPQKQWLLPPIFLIWANLHGGFVLGLIVLGGYWIINKFTNFKKFSNKALPSKLIQALSKAQSFLSPLKTRDSSNSLNDGNLIRLWVLCLSFLATFINPYGADLYTEIARTAFDNSLRFRIVEWLPVHYSLTTSLYLVIFGAVFWTSESKKLRALISLRGLLLLMALSSTRHIPFFVLSSLSPFEKYKTLLIERVSKINDSKPRLVWRFMLSILVIATIYATWSTIPLSTDREASYPKETAQYLQNNPCTGQIFNDYNFGGYLIWKLPSHPVYIDGRMPSWRYKGINYLENYIKIFNDDQFRRAEFNKYTINCVIIAKEFDNRNWLERRFELNKPQENLAEKLQKEGWEIVLEDNASVLLLSP